MNELACNDHSSLKGLFECPKCGADLTLSPQEIEARDKIFKFFYEIYEKHKDGWELKEKYSGFVLEREHFDDWLSRNAVTFSLFVGNTLLKRSDKPSEERPEKSVETPKKEGSGNLERRVAELEKKFEKICLLKQACRRY